MSCEKIKEVYVAHPNKNVNMNCGDTGIGGSTILCAWCTKMYEERYPQGWRYAPGDICEHHVYHSPYSDCACYRCEEKESE
jgi:hypothetical protein